MKPDGYLDKRDCKAKSLRISGQLSMADNFGALQFVTIPEQTLNAEKMRVVEELLDSQDLKGSVVKDRDLKGFATPNIVRIFGANDEPALLILGDDLFVKHVIGWRKSNHTHLHLIEKWISRNEIRSTSTRLPAPLDR